MSSIVASAAVLFAEAERMGLTPVWLTSFGVFFFQIDHKTIYLFDGRSHLNSLMATYLSGDKYVTRLILEKHGLPNIPYLQTESRDQAINFLKTNKRIILKPTFGSHDEGIYLIESETELKKRNLDNNLLEKYIDGREIRYLVLDDEVIAVHERRHNGVINEKTGVTRISFEKKDWDENLIAIARKASTVLSLRFAAVDFLVTPAEEVYILEVNSAPGIWWFHEPNEGPPVNVAKMIIEKTIQEVTK